MMGTRSSRGQRDEGSEKNSCPMEGGWGSWNRTLAPMGEGWVLLDSSMGWRSWKGPLLYGWVWRDGGEGRGGEGVGLGEAWGGRRRERGKREARRIFFSYARRKNKKNKKNRKRNTKTDWRRQVCSWLVQGRSRGVLVILVYSFWWV